MSEDNSDIEEEEPYEYPHNVVIQLKRQLTVRGKVYLTLQNVEEGYVKRIRFMIVSLCPRCGGANHVKLVDRELPANNCEACSDSQVFAGKTRIFPVYAPIGTRHGSTINIPDEGSYGPEGIRGDIIVTFLDKPHEHFLRVFDDIIVCFQINHKEKSEGAIRLLTLAVPTSHDIILKTEAGEPIHNNDVLYVNNLGLPNYKNKTKRGRLIIVFVVKDQRSMFPVKLKNINMSFGSVIGSVSSDEPSLASTSQPILLNERKEADSTAPITNGLKRSRAARRQNPRKRKKGTFTDSKAYTSSESLSTESDSQTKSSTDRVSSPVNPPSVEIIKEIDQARCSRILNVPFNRLTASEVELKGSLESKKLLFLDRLAYSQAIPLPYRTVVKDAIPMSTLTILWKRKYDPHWWERVQCTQALDRDPDSLMEQFSPYRSRAHSNVDISINKPLFDVQNVTLNESEEALKNLSTMQSYCNAEFLQFTPQKLSSGEKIRLFNNMRKYLHKMVP